MGISGRLHGFFICHRAVQYRSTAQRPRRILVLRQMLRRCASQFVLARLAQSRVTSISPGRNMSRITTLVNPKAGLFALA
jgi:hypothetical protein